VGLDAQKGFTKMNKNIYMSYGIWVEMTELKTIEIEKATKEVGGG
jgi:hypothetical protein